MKAWATTNAKLGTVLFIACLISRSAHEVAAQAKDRPGFPPVEQLPEIKELPDPFLMRDGKRVASLTDWQRRREEIAALLAYYQFGHMPPAPGNVTAEEKPAVDVIGGKAVEKQVRLSFGPEAKLKLSVTLTIPKGKGPFPVIVRNYSGPKWSLVAPADKHVVLERNYLLAEYLTTDLQPDVTAKPGPAKLAYPDHDWGAIAIWAWGGMRVIDYLATLPEVDKGKLAVTGHSRHGRTALLTGALDERVALVAPNASGCGGVELWRYPLSPTDPRGKGAHEDVALMRTPPHTYWFHPRLWTFAKKETRLPFDTHCFMALVAPRYLCAVEAMEDEYVTPIGTQRSYQAAKVVYDWLGPADKLGIYYRAKGGHNQGTEDWEALLDFADRAFFGKQPKRRFDHLPYPDAKPAFSWQSPAKPK